MAMLADSAARMARCSEAEDTVRGAASTRGTMPCMPPAAHQQTGPDRHHKAFHAAVPALTPIKTSTNH